MYHDAAAAGDSALKADVDVEKYAEPAWSGSVAGRSLVPVEELKKVSPNHPVFDEPQGVSYS